MITSHNYLINLIYLGHNDRSLPHKMKVHFISFSRKAFFENQIVDKYTLGGYSKSIKCKRK